MLSSYFIPFHTSRYNRKKRRRLTSTFDKSLSYGVVCSYKSLIGQDNVVESFVEDLKNKGKKVSMLVFHENTSNVQGVSNNSFSKSDLNFFGIWKSDAVKVFFDKEFDFLIHLDLDYNLFIGNILAQSRAHCRMGIHDVDAESFLELMIKPEKNTIGSLIVGMNSMLERIRNDE